MESQLQEWQRGVLEYLRICDGGVKDKHWLDDEYSIRLVRNSECNYDCGGDTGKMYHRMTMMRVKVERRGGP